MRLYTILDKLASLKTEQYPVGMVLTFSTAQDLTMLTKLYGGSWEQMGQGRVLMGVGTPGFNTTDVYGEVGGQYQVYPNDKGGSSDQIVVNHTHTQTDHTHEQTAHIHTMNSHTHTQAAHGHTPAASENFLSYTGTLSTTIKGTADSSYIRPQLPKNGGSWNGSSKTSLETPAINGTVATMQEAGGGSVSGAQANIQTAGVSGTNRNLPPFEAVYFYKKVRQ